MILPAPTATSKPRQGPRLVARGEARRERLRRVILAASNYIADQGADHLTAAALPGVIDGLQRSIVELRDDGGQLTVVWKRQPSWDERAGFFVGWESESEDGEDVIHRGIGGEA